jgi:hypothetical protein
MEKQTRKNCEHELTLKDEWWKSEIEVGVVAQCGKCKATFTGLLKEEGI